MASGILKRLSVRKRCIFEAFLSCVFLSHFGLEITGANGLELWSSGSYKFIRKFLRA